MATLEVFRPQSDFPINDLKDAAVPYVEYYLRQERSDRSYATMLRESLHQLHITAYQALQICGVEVDYSEKEYDAFCSGFAALDYTVNLVGRKALGNNIAARKVQKLLIDGATTSDLELAERFKIWQTTHPNTFSVIVGIGAEEGETMKQLQTRAIGAEISWELQVE